MMSKALSQRMIFPDPDTGRLDWVDTTKAILITMVVMGHFGTLNPEIKKILYAFHVPAFLIVTGFLLPKSLFAMPTGAFFQRYIFPYVRLTLFFMMVSILLWWVLRGRDADERDIWDVVLNGLYGTRSQAHRLLHGNGPLWYLPYLVSSFLGLWIAIRLPRPIGYAFVVGYAAFSLLWQGVRLPWSLDSAGIGLLFMLCGYVLKTQMQRVPPVSEITLLTPGARIFGLGLCLAFAITTVVIAHLNGRTNINVLNFGHNPILLVFGALAGTAAIICFSLLMPGTTLARHLSRHTLVIFCTHIFLVRAVSAHIDIDDATGRLAVVVAAGVAITLLCSLLSLVLMPFLERFILLQKQPRSDGEARTPSAVVQN